MEPNANNSTPSPAPNPMDDLHAEGIDIVGTSMALDNEFSTPESGEAAPKAADIETPEPPAPSEPIKLKEPEVLEPATIQAPKKDEGPIIYSKRPIDVSEALKPEPMPEPKKEPAPLASENDPSIKSIRTFKSDAEEAVKYGNVSKVSIAVAEQKRRESSTPIDYDEGTTSHWKLYVGIVLVLLVAVGGAYYWYSSTIAPATNPVPAGITFSPIVPYAKGSSVLIDPTDLQSDPFGIIGARLDSANPGAGNVFALLPIESSTATGLEPIADVLSRTHIPDRLLRSLGSQYMIGMYSYNKQYPFLILKNTFFQNAFSGMLDWEKNMGSDFLPLIAVSYPGETSEALATSFEDAVVSNIDIRTLKDPTGQIVLAYAFADNDTIVIATGIDPLKYLLDRILSVRTIQ